MKDACHHLKNIQKKVVQENRRALEREGNFIQKEMARDVIEYNNNGSFTDHNNVRVHKKNPV